MREGFKFWQIKVVNTSQVTEKLKLTWYEYEEWFGAVLPET